MAGQSVFAEILDHGEGATEACTALEELSRQIAVAPDGDAATAIHFAIEREVKAIKAAASKALKASNKAMAGRVERRHASHERLPLWRDPVQEFSRLADDYIEAKRGEGRAVPDNVDPETGEIRD